MIQSLRSILPLLGAFTLLATDTTGPVNSAPLRFDPAETKIEFTLGDVLHTVHGTFQLKRGTVRFDAATGTASGELVVDAASGDSGNPARDHQMHAAVLESAAYPDIVFHPDRVEGPVASQGVSRVSVHGTFEIHGAAHEVTLPAEILADNGLFNTTLHFEVPYQKWGMKNPSKLFFRVSDKVDITVRTVARR